MRVVRVSYSHLNSKRLSGSVHVTGQLLTCSSSHKHQQLPLIPVNEFLERHPEHAEDDEKTIMIARINHEHSERETLEQERQGLLKKKQGLIAENKKRKDDLASLDSDLEKFIDVSPNSSTPYHERGYRGGVLIREGCQTDPNNAGKGVLRLCAHRGLYSALNTDQDPAVV